MFLSILAFNQITFLLALCIVQMLLFSKPEIGSPMSYGKSLAGSLEKKDHIVELILLSAHIDRTQPSTWCIIATNSGASKLEKYKSL